MAKRRRSRNLGGRFVPLPFWLLDSFAWRQLTPTDQAVWVRLAKRYDGANNGRLAAPVRAIADEINVSHHTVARALQNLTTYRFIERTKASSFSKKDRKASEYRMTHMRCDVTGELATKPFMSLGKSAVNKDEQSHLSPSQSHG